MNYDVFICHSSKDKPVADNICRLLENDGVTCWIAPRNVKPGRIYAEEIVDGIEASMSIILILSEHANDSPHVRNEIELGIKRGKVIIPVLIENIKPSKSLEYYISTSQWVEAWTTPPDQKIMELSGVIKSIRLRKTEKAVVPDPIIVPEKKTEITDVQAGKADHLNKNQIPESLKTLDGLTVILSGQLEQHSFEEANSTISEILRIDQCNRDALNAQNLIDRRQGLGKTKSFAGPGVAIQAFFSGDGQKITAGFGGITGHSPSAKPPTIIVWDVISEQKLFEYSILRSWKPTCMALSPDEQTILLGDLFSIYLISIKNKKIIADYQAGWIQHVSFLPFTNQAITAGNELLLWDFELGSVIYRFKGHTGRIQSHAITPDGEMAGTSGEDGTLRLWDLKTKQEIWCIDRYQLNFKTITISPDGKKILLGSSKGIYLLDLFTGEELLSFPGHQGCQSTAISPDGKRAISGGTDNIIRYYDLEKQKQIRGYLTTGSWTGSVGFSPDGQFALSGDISNINLWALPE